jgi:hypothetical protein
MLSRCMKRGVFRGTGKGKVQERSQDTRASHGAGAIPYGSLDRRVYG